MVEVRGLVKGPSGSSFENHRVTLAFGQRVALDGDKPEDATVLPAERSLGLPRNGRFTLELPELDQLVAPVEAVVAGPTGQELARERFSLDELKKQLTIAAKPAPRFAVRPSDDPTLGKRLRLTGRVIDERGEQVPAGLAVVVWGVDAPEAEPRPLVVTATQIGGYFASDWPADELKRAFGTVQHGDEVAIPLEGGRLPDRVILVTRVEQPEGADDGACDCEAEPPRTPDVADLTQNPAAFSQDLGGRCVDLTVPNRVLEEFPYFLVVRTGEPDIRGVTVGGGRPLPDPVLGQLLGVLRDRTAVAMRAEPRALVEGDGVIELDNPAKVTLDVQTARRLLQSPEPIDVVGVKDRAIAATIADIVGLVGATKRPAAGRVPLDEADAIDWDDTPTLYEATTAVSGHILQFRQVWRADGYSLGDLLYSLPLAPGQKRQIAVLDWERRETAVRTEALDEEEQLDALLSRDRDVSEIVGSHLSQEMSGGSNSSMWGVAGGIGAGFIGSGFGIFGGVAGGGSGASSNAWQNSARELTASSLQQLSDRTTQRASALRDQRSTVVQTVAQGESVRAETEVVANYNHCHAITVEYFEVLRHFLVTHDLADVRECLFVPLPMEPFDRAKALRWREPLGRFLRRPELSGGFGAIERIFQNWDGWDFPDHRYSEEAPESLDGELRISFLLPRPRDDKDGAFQVDQWEWLRGLLDTTPLALWTAELAAREAAERDRFFLEHVAPGIAERLVQKLRFAYVTPAGAEVAISLDGTLVSRYQESVPLYVSIRPAGGLTALPREEIARFKVWYDGDELPPDARVILHSGKVRYRTPHLVHLLFDEPRILNDLGRDDAVIVATPLARDELRDPRQEDRRLGDRLVKHLNEHLEFYHQAIWATMDPNRRYLLLDGAIAPNSGGRSVASVVENRLIGIVGNSLVLPVAPGNHLDPILADPEKRADLLHAYAADPPPPLRISVPTRGVYAEAVPGQCDACEVKDDTRYWRWEQSPIPEQPAGIEPLSTDSRVTPEPDLKPTPFPQPIVAIQNAPELPDPLGLSQAFQILAKPDLFKDITGLEGTQKNALAAFQGALDTAKFMGGEASKLAQQQALGKSVDRTMDQITKAQKDGLLSDQQAQSLAFSALKGLVGEPRPAEQSPAADPAVSKAIDAATQSERGKVTVSTPTETVEASFEGGAGALGTGGTVPGNAVEPTPVEKLKIDYLPDEMVFAPNMATFRVKAGTRDKAIIEAVSVLSKDGKSVFDLGKAVSAKGLIDIDQADGSKFVIPMPLRIKFPADPAALDAVAGTGKLPLAVLVHGNHDAWGFVWGPQHGTREIGGKTLKVFDSATTIAPIPSYRGYEYLQDELARNGIISVSVDTNIANFLGSLVEMRAELVLQAIKVMKRLDGTAGSPFAGRIDFDRIGLMGHSRGGDAVVRAARKNIDERRGFGIRAVCSLAPTDLTGLDTGGMRQTLKATDNLFYLVVYGSLDGDVSGVGGARSFAGTGFRHYDRATCPKAMVFLHDCNHNRFNRVWSDSDPADAGQTVNLRDDHEKVAKEYIGGLFRWQLLAENAQSALFNGGSTNSAGIAVSQQWAFGDNTTPFQNFKLVDDFQALKNSLGGNRSIPLGERKMFDLVQVGGKDMNEKTSHQTFVLHVDVSSPPGSTRCLETQIPAGVHRDWSGYELLTLSIAADFDTTNDTTIGNGKLPNLKVTLTDSDGGSATLDQTRFVPSPSRPWLHKGSYNGATKNLTLIRLETVAFKLSDFVGVQRSKINAVLLDVDPANKTHLFLDAIAVVKR